MRCEKCKAPLQTSVPVSSSAEESPAVEAPAPGSLEADVLALMQGGKKIQAVKLCRERKGIDLKAAKDYVESLAAKHGVKPNSGCGGVVLLFLIVGATMAGTAWALWA